MRESLNMLFLRAEFDLSLFDIVIQHPSIAENINGPTICLAVNWSELEGV